MNASALRWLVCVTVFYSAPTTWSHADDTIISNGTTAQDALTAPEINNNGQVGYLSSTNNLNLWSAGTTTVAVNGNADGFYIFNSPQVPTMNNSGNFAFIAESISDPNNFAVMTNSGGSLNTIASTNTQIGGNNITQSLLDSNDSGGGIAFNDSGEVALSVTTANNNKNYVVTGSGGGLTIVSTSGSSIPGLSGITPTPFSLNANSPILSDNGAVYFSQIAENGAQYSYGVVMHGGSSSLGLTLAEGSSVTNPVSGTTVIAVNPPSDNFNYGQVNASGELALAFGSSALSTTGPNEQAIVGANGSTLSTLAWIEQSAPGGTFSGFKSNEVINNNGLIAFDAALNAYTGEGLFRTNPTAGQFTSIATVGGFETTASGLSTNKVYSSFGAYQLNNNGDVLFNAELDNSGGNTSAGTGLYEGNGTDTVFITNDSSAYVGFAYPNQVINDLGQVVYKDNSGEVHLFTPDLNWEGGRSGSWETGAWTLGLNPDNSSVYNVEIGSNATVSTSQSHTVNNLTVGNATLSAGNSLTANGSVTIANKGLVYGSNGTLTGTTGVNVQTGGSLAWTGNVSGNVTNAGFVSTDEPGSTLHINGNYTQTGGGELYINAFTANPGAESDLLSVSGTANLGGLLDLNFLDTPVLGQTYTVLNAGNVNGTFSSYLGTVQGGLVLNPTYSSTGLTFTVANLGSGTSAPAQVVAPGSSASIGMNSTYAGLTSTNTSGNQTTATILAGTATAVKQVSFTFSSAGAFAATGPGGGVVSDVVSLSGTNTDLIVLQLNYSPAQMVALGLNPAAATLDWYDTSLGKYVLAVDGNTDGGASAHFVSGAYDPATDDILGYYGNDTVDDRVWAVVDHNSDFAVAVVPEPTSWTMLIAGVLGLFAYNHVRSRRKQR